MSQRVRMKQCVMLSILLTILAAGSDAKAATEVKADPANELRGRVVNGDGEGISGARIFQFRNSLVAVDMSPATEPQAVSGADGSFELALANAEEVSLLVQAEDYLQRLERNLRPGGGPLVVVLEEASRLEMKLRDAAGRPLPDLHVILRDDDPAKDRITDETYFATVHEFTAFTDGEGKASFKAVPRGKLWFSVVGLEVGLFDQPIEVGGEAMELEVKVGG